MVLTGTSARADGQRRDRIMEAAGGLFMARGYAGVSTRDIATVARVSKRELYALFENKQAILTACIARRTGSINVPVSLPPATSRAVLEAALIQFGTRALVQLTLPSTISVYRLAIVESAHAPEIAQALESSGRLPLRTAMVEFLIGAQGRQLLDADDPAVMTGQFFALLFGETRMRLVMGLDQPPSEAECAQRARATTEAFLRLHGR